MTADRSFDSSLNFQSERAWELYAVVADELDTLRKRKVKQDSIGKTGALRSMIVANLIVHHLKGGPSSGVRVPRGKSTLAQKPSRYEPYSFPRSFPKLLDDLRKAKYLHQTTGVYSGARGLSKQTTIRAGSKLIRLIADRGLQLSDMGAESGNGELIVLGRTKVHYGDQGGRQDYTDTKVTNGYRADMMLLNDWLSRSHITFDATVHQDFVDPTCRSLRRHFSNDSFEQGGRLFGGFWQVLPKDVRAKGIRIEGESTASADYTSINAALAYWVAKAPPPEGDAYTLPKFEHYRSLVKTIFNAMLFSRVTQFPKGVRAEFSLPKALRLTDIKSAILAKHSGLSGFLSGSGIGHKLQFHESEILIEVLKRCRSGGIVALPIHDSVIVKASNFERAKAIMKAVYKSKTGRGIIVRLDS